MVVTNHVKKNKGDNQPWGKEMEEVRSPGTWRC